MSLRTNFFSPIVISLASIVGVGVGGIATIVKVDELVEEYKLRDRFAKISIDNPHGLAYANYLQHCIQTDRTPNARDNLVNFEPSVKYPKSKTPILKY